MSDYILSVEDESGEVKARLVQWVFAIYRALPAEQQRAVRADLLRMNRPELESEEQ